MYKKYFKRLFDIVISVLALIILSPIMLIVGFLIRVKLGAPVVFTQERPGKINPKTGKERIFKMYKFKSMLPPQARSGRILTDDERLELLRTGQEDVLTDDERLTKFGRFLRASSLDELMELINIIKGDMSIVGPRPLAVIYLQYYTEMERQRHSVLPGLTGFAQVNGRNAISWEKKFEYDIEYANNVSLYMDISIIIKTVLVVLKHNNIGQAEAKPEAFHIQRQKQLQGQKQLDQVR